MFSFDGRIGRGEWWGLSILAMVGIFIAFMIAAEIPILYLIVWPANIVVHAAIATRRLHDLGHSGALYLLVLIPFVGALVLLVMCGFIPGEPRHNRYGPAAGYVDPQYYAPSAPTPQMRAEVHPSLREANERAWQSNARTWQG